MNPAMIPAYIEQRLKELGHCQGYAMRVKHFSVPGGKTIRVAAYGELYLLLEEAADIQIESELGVFNTSGADVPMEQQHEHTGQITITNLAAEPCGVQFIQAIPLEKTCETC